MEDLTLSFDAYNAQLLRGVIRATMPSGEEAAETHARAATIIAMFKGFEPREAMESMIACHCIALQFALLAAMRDVSAAAGAPDPRTQTRMWATGVSLSKTLHLWLGKYEAVQARNEARGAEAAQTAPPARTVSPPPTAARPPVTKAPTPEAPVTKVPETSAPRALPRSGEPRPVAPLPAGPASPPALPAWQAAPSIQAPSIQVPSIQAATPPETPFRTAMLASTVLMRPNAGGAAPPDSGVAR